MFPDFMNRDDVGVIEARCRTRFLCETRHPFRIGGKSGREKLDGDVSVQVVIQYPIHFPHSPGADQRENLVAAETHAHRKDMWRIPLRTKTQV